MLEKAGIALCPGNYFGKGGEGYVRLCFATSQDIIVRGMERMRKTLINAE
jgi:aspartate/methionine/tyrosine aminotransferase